MFLVRLVYVSRAKDGFNADDIESILLAARRKNLKSNITGLLCFSQKVFLQCLEGPRREVNETYQMIAQDDRHTDLIILSYHEIIKRDFSSWSMGYIPEVNLTRELNITYSPTPEFDPYEMSGESAHQLLTALKSVVPSQ